MLRVLDDMAEEAAGESASSEGKISGKGMGFQSDDLNSPKVRQELEEAIRALYGG
jgi:hypothetical protein